jgi:hypothetical protein
MTSLALFCGLLLWFGAALAEPRAFFDRPQIYEGDTVTLTIEADGLSAQQQPDLSVLADDFDMLGTSTGSEIRIVNGRRSDKVSWRVSLSPKRLGEIQVPPISVGGERTKPLTLTVSEVPQDGAGGAGDDVFVELELGIDGDTVLVQQQVPVVVRLFSALPIRGGELSDPRADGAVLERLGADTQYSTNRNGREYQVIERRFSLSPERSGELRIAPVVFEGELRSPRGARAPFDRDPGVGLFNDPMFEQLFGDSPLSMFERGQPVRALSRAATLQVQARPDSFGGAHWLPAEALAIDDSWARNPPLLRAGEPATRTLTVTARGLAGTQIPQLDVPLPPGVRAYPEQPETQSRTDGATLFGVSIQRLTLIPTNGGQIEMPEIRVSWWDTTAETERVATVPSVTLDVEGPAAAAPSSSVPEVRIAESAEPDVPSQTGSGTSPEARPGTRPEASPETTSEAADGGASTAAGAGVVWLMWAVIGLLVLVLAALAAGVWWRRRRRSGATPSAIERAPVAPPIDAGAQREALHQACQATDPNAAARALLGWTQALWSDAATRSRTSAPPVNLAGVAERLAASGSEAGSRAAEQVLALERHLYAPGSAHWQGEALWLAVKDVLSNERAASAGRLRTETDDLAPLYPRRA